MGIGWLDLRGAPAATFVFVEEVALAVARLAALTALLTLLALLAAADAMTGAAVPDDAVATPFVENGLAKNLR